MKSALRTFKPGRSNLYAKALWALIASGLIGGTSFVQAASQLDQALSAYDAAINAGPTNALAKLTSPVTLDGTAGAAFDFGATAGDTTIEFILEGNPASGPSAYLAVGQNSTSSLRYEQYQNTRQMGFTQSGINDYLFTPGVPSPTIPTHITYVWDSLNAAMSLYVDGTLAGSNILVDATFAMPSGAGFLGSTPAGGETMVGTVYRVTVYSGMLPDTTIATHAAPIAKLPLPVITAFTATPTEIQPLGSATLSWQVQNTTTVFLNNVVVTGTSQTVSPPVTTTYTLIASNEIATATAKVKVLVDPQLDVYDAAIAADAGTGLAPLATLTNTVTLDGTAGSPFDFGATTNDVTMEFILEGDPTAGLDGYLAVGATPSSSLRYAQYASTQQMGFTQSGVADYLFVPAVPSPTIATHVAYVWNSTALAMTIYVNGVASGTVTNVSSQFAMPSGAGFLGSSPSGSEAMVGRIFRVVVYAQMLPEATIQNHAKAFTSVLHPPIIKFFTATPTQLVVGQGTSLLQWQVQDVSAVFLNGANVTTVTNQTVSPSGTTTYSLIASNNVATVTNQVTVVVVPRLDKYDAAIAADAAGGLTPLALLTNTVTLNGSGGVPFDFGATSGDTTMEFILEGDPTFGADGYLAVGATAANNLRYAAWPNTHQMGFTELAVADYLFTPAVPSPTTATLVVYVWNSTDLSMNIYTNGVLAGTCTNVDSNFAMPSGAGFLGSTPTGGEGMVGQIFRVVVYSGMEPEATIQKHASAFTSEIVTPVGPSLSIAVMGSASAITLHGVAGTHYRIEYRNSLSSADAWQLLQDIPSLGGASLQVADPTPTTGRSQRFYRAAALP